VKTHWIVLLLAISALGTACATTEGNTPVEKRASIKAMSTEVLNDLYERKPAARQEIAASPGYGVFNNANINIIFASFGGGHGVVHNNSTGADMYMKMGEIGIGLGIGIKDFRAVFVFHDTETMSDFITKGWEFGGHADAAAKAGDKGAAVSAEALIDRVTVYQLTESGLALQATVKGTKYWVDNDLM
jgi:lipid-binding SYLF domain-containing protein